MGGVGRGQDTTARPPLKPIFTREQQGAGTRTKSASTKASARGLTRIVRAANLTGRVVREKKLVSPSGRFSNFPGCVAPWRAQGECLIAGAINIGTTSLPHPALVLQRRTRFDPNASTSG